MRSAPRKRVIPCAALTCTNRADIMWLASGCVGTLLCVWTSLRGPFGISVEWWRSVRVQCKAVCRDSLCEAVLLGSSHLSARWPVEIHCKLTLLCCSMLQLWDDVCAWGGVTSQWVFSLSYLSFVSFTVCWILVHSVGIHVHWAHKTNFSSFTPTSILYKLGPK